ncbi:hypothetical protein Tco_0641672 [Tanacetum coccineum]
MNNELKGVSNCKSPNIAFPVHRSQGRTLKQSTVNHQISQKDIHKLPQADDEDLLQIDEDAMEEIALVAGGYDNSRIRSFLRKTGRTN